MNKPIPISNEDFKPMASFPKDGTRCQLKFQQGETESREAFFWGDNLMGAGQCIRGDQNAMSKWLVPIGWRVFPT